MKMESSIFQLSLIPISKNKKISLDSVDAKGKELSMTLLKKRLSVDTNDWSFEIFTMFLSIFIFFYFFCQNSRELLSSYKPQSDKI